jgi:hypothetical protein
MKLTTAQEEACRRLGSVVSEARSGDFEEDLWSLLESDAHGGPEGDEFAGSDDEECEDFSEEEEAECVEARPCIVENSTQRHILDLLVALFTHLPSGMDDKFYSPIHRFLVLSSLKGNGQWLPGRRVTQTFAALLFCGREVMMALMHKEITRSPGLRYSGYVLLTLTNFVPAYVKVFHQGIPDGVFIHGRGAGGSDTHDVLAYEIPQSICVRRGGNGSLYGT